MPPQPPEPEGDSGAETSGDEIDSDSEPGSAEYSDSASLHSGETMGSEDFAAALEEVWEELVGEGALLAIVCRTCGSLPYMSQALCHNTCDGSHVTWRFQS
jgi:hypothetical protein